MNEIYVTIWVVNKNAEDKIMIPRVKGTDITKKAIVSIVKDLQKNKPTQKHVDYLISLKSKSRNVELVTDENKGELRNISILRINASKAFSSIRAAIGNTTGDLLLEERPFFMSTKKALKKIEEALTQLQPENRINPQKVSAKTPRYNSQSYNRFETKEHFEKFDIVSRTDGSDSTESFEFFDPYKVL